VLIGPDQTRFSVHKDVLCQRSSFFNAAFSGDWKEKNERKIALPDDNEELFSKFLGWAYTDDLDLGDEANERRTLAVPLYGFADKLGATALKNKIMDQLCNKVSRKVVPSTKMARRAFDDLQDGCKMQEYILDAWIYQNTPLDFKPPYELPESCMNKLVCRLFEQRTQKFWRRNSDTGFGRRCCYHQHDSFAPKRPKCEDDDDDDDDDTSDDE